MGRETSELCVLIQHTHETYCQITVLSVRATVGSAHGVSDYSLVTQRMAHGGIACMHGSTPLGSNVEQRY